MSGAVDVQLGDLWRYDERHDVPSMVGQERRIAALPNGKLVAVDDKGEVRTSSLSYLINHARLISRAGQPVTAIDNRCGAAELVTAEHDRSGCKAFCGLTCSAINHGDDETFRAYVDVEDFRESESRSIDTPRWCSARCRDLRLPPIDSNRIPVAEARGADDTRRATPSSSPLTAVRDAHGTPTPARVGAQPGGSRTEGQTIASPTAGSASPANVPPVPAVGQRWKPRNATYYFDVVGLGSLSGQPHVIASSPEYAEYGDQWITVAAFKSYEYLGPTPPAERQNRPACDCGARGREGHDHSHRCVVVAWNRAQKKPKRPPGIQCRRCLATSEHGDQHLETCTTSDFAPSDRDLTSEEWSAQVHYELLRLEGEREDAARPFVPDISDEELFGRAVKP